MQRFLLFKSLFLILLIPVLGVLSCTNKNNNDLLVFEALNNTFINANKIIIEDNDELYQEYLNKTYDVISREKALLYLPTVDSVKKFSKSITGYLDDLAKTLQSEAYIQVDHKQMLNANSFTVLFDRQNESAKLSEKLLKYRKQLLGLDSALTKEFSNNEILNSLNKDAGLISNVSPIVALAMINKLKYDCGIIENSFFKFYEYKTSVIVDYYLKTKAIAVVDNQYVKPGEEVTVTAGIGEFNDAANPDIYINKQKIPLDQDGVAVCNFKAPVTTGKYIVPVKITYARPDGTKEVMELKEEYNVINPCN
ncbi:hypothetical protein [Ferruginibacter albus]|uniref:hypothetical protein n=1 Tax=Ferruginibacter albus TaxID=2875540 RepID=UPI001CC5515A|nr:hypothetical protein [Ferruginibacter albus]UAY53617.1 hypothetical protein K9M53_08100 [Ferruginibacter albus]